MGHPGAWRSWAGGCEAGSGGGTVGPGWDSRVGPEQQGFLGPHKEFEFASAGNKGSSPAGDLKWNCYFCSCTHLIAKI